VLKIHFKEEKMKNILVLIAVLGFVACSSKGKNESKEMVSQTEAEATDSENDAKAAYEEAQREAEEAAQKAAKEAQASNSSDDSNDSAMTGGGDFGPYEGTEKSKFTCTSGDDVRTVAVLDGNSGGCGVVYNKMGNDKTIAVANYDMEFCPEVQNKVKGNLEAANFTCE
jgi:Tfp pilus assembly protein PilP